MELNQRVANLLADEKFQEEFFNLNTKSQECCRSFKLKYSLSDTEFFYVRNFFASITFKNTLADQSDVNYALYRLKQNINSTKRIAKLNRSGFWVWTQRFAAFLAIPLVLSTLYFYQKSVTNNTSLYSYAGKTDVINTFSAPLGAKTQVILPDGSLVWLNSGSKLWCPARFGTKSRDVKLVGEAYFEVVKNKNVPMIISVRSLKVNVFGTSFNLRAYEDDANIETTLVEGKITINSEKSGKKYQIKPGHSVSYNQGSEKFKEDQVDNLDVYIGWKDGKLLFRNQRFGDIVKNLERWFGVDIRLKEPTLANYVIYATFYDENIEQILKIISNSIPIKVNYRERYKLPDGSYSKLEINIDRNIYKQTKIY